MRHARVGKRRTQVSDERDDRECDTFLRNRWQYSCSYVMELCHFDGSPGNLLKSSAVDALQVKDSGGCSVWDWLNLRRQTLDRSGSLARLSSEARI